MRSFPLLLYNAKWGLPQALGRVVQSRSDDKTYGKGRSNMRPLLSTYESHEVVGSMNGVWL